MIEASEGELRRAVEEQHGGSAALAGIHHVHERLNGETVWKGQVHVFDLTRLSRPKRVYAWSSVVEGSDAWRLFAIPHTGEIESASDAVRYVIGVDQRNTKRG